MRARAHAREKVTRIAIIDRPLSMIVGGRVGALFFIVCFLSVLEIQIERFCISPPRMQIEWMKRAGKERTKGVRVRRVLTCAGEFLSFFVFFSLSSCYCISSLFFIEEEVNDDTWRKEHFLGKNSSLSFFETGFEYRGIGAWGSFVSIKIESSLLFFLDCRNMWQHNVSRASICDAQPIMTLGSHEIDRRNFDRWSTLIFDWNISLKIPYVFKSICVF